MADGLLASGLNYIDQQKQALAARLGLLMNNPQEFAAQLGSEARQRAGVGLLGEPKTAQDMASGAWINSPYGQQAMQAGSGFAGSIIPIRQEALDIASKNAEKMLGLPKGNTQMDRAKAMGFDMNMYHGTDVPLIEAFDPEKTKIIKGIFTTNEPKTASKYAIEAGLKKRAESFGMESSPNILPLMIRSESHARLPKFDKQTIDMFKNFGNQGVYRDEMGVAVTFDPSQIRSRFAAFDPARMKEPDILAAGVPLGLIAGTNVEMPKKEKRK
jgi:hypothetical protein